MATFGPDFVCGSTTLVILSTMLVSNCFAQLGGYAVYMSGRSWLVMSSTRAPSRSRASASPGR